MLIIYPATSCGIVTFLIEKYLLLFTLFCEDRFYFINNVDVHDYSIDYIVLVVINIFC